MKFIKKNWGLLLVLTVCSALSLTLAVFVGAAAKRLSENKAKVETEMKFFAEVKKSGVKLNKDNVNIAEDNAKSVKKRFVKLRKSLSEKFKIEIAPPKTAVEGVNTLRSEIEKMRKDLTDGGVMLPQQTNYLSFEEYGQQNKLPPMSQIPEIFRQLRIIQEVVRLILESKVDALIEIRRPMGLESEDGDGDLYKTTPLDLTVSGDNESVQTLINSFHQASNYLFFIRKLELSSEDQAPNGNPGATGITGGGAGGAGGARGAGLMGGAGMMEGGMMDGGGMGGFAPPGGRQGFGGGMGGAMMEGGMMEGGGVGAGSSLNFPVLLTRQQLVAFRDRYVTAVLRLDLIEYQPPEEEEE